MAIRRVALCAALAAAAPLRGESSAPPTPGAHVSIAAGPEYAASGFHSLWLGKGYRDLWTRPIRVPVVDLGSFAGGLRPVRRVGRLQTLGLALEGANGRAYTFRALEKQPERILPPEWRESWPARIVRDHTSATHPGAALLVEPLAEAASLLHTAPALVVLPDDPALGEFRGEFAGRLGTLDEYPRVPEREGGVAFAGAREIVSSVELWSRWLEVPGTCVDARAFLRARLLDLLVEDYDRHPGQWRWALLPGEPGWQPIAEDPDMAFIRNEGLAISAVRRRAPKFVRFESRFPRRLEGSTFAGAPLDRWLLSGLDRAAFEEVARDLALRIDDSVIARAVAALPPEWRSAGEREIAPALRARRDALVAQALRFYRDLARQVDLQLTDGLDTVHIASRPGGALAVTVESGGDAPLFSRVFTPAETREVRIRLHGGDDRVVREGAAGGPVRVRVVAGPGSDRVDDTAAGGTEVWAGEGSLEVAKGSGTRTHAAWRGPAPDPAAPWSEPRDAGRWTMPYTQLAYASELDVLVGFGIERRSWGFRASPEASHNDASVLWSTGENRGRLEYGGVFRRPASRAAFSLDALASGIERVNYFGAGNETERPGDPGGYRTDEQFLALTPGLAYEPVRHLQLQAGATLRYSSSPTGRDNALDRSGAYGAGEFGEAGLRAGLHFDSRGLSPRLDGGGLFETIAPRGRAADWRLEANGFYFPALLDVRSGFGGVEAELAGYAGPPRGRLQLAGRVGGRRVWGEYPWFESAFLGGRVSLRGYSRNRFAGDASLYAGGEARLWLFSIDVPPVPLRVGLLGFGDVGRVWLAGEHSDLWHTSWGGGAMLQPLATPLVLTVAVAASSEGRRWYFGYGFFF